MEPAGHHEVKRVGRLARGNERLATFDRHQRKLRLKLRELVIGEVGERFNIRQLMTLSLTSRHRRHTP